MFKVQQAFARSTFKVQRPHVPPLNLEPETLNRAEGDTLNFEH